MQSFPSIVRLFYLMQRFHPYLFVTNIQPGLDIYLWLSKPASIYMTKLPVDNPVHIISAN